MIEHLYIDGFKSLHEADLKLGRLTLLVGENGAGKSSLLQLLLLLRQSAVDGDIDSINLFGPLFEAGTAFDLLHPAADYQIKLNWKEGDVETKLKLLASRTDASGLEIRRLSVEPKVSIPKSLLGPGFTYLNAERIGPRLWSKVSPSSNVGGHLGKYGEYTAAYFSQCVNEQLKATGWVEYLNQEGVVRLLNIQSDEVSETEGLQHRIVNLLLGKVLPGLRVKSDELSSMDAASLKYIRDPGGTNVETRPTHVGFGYSVVLPVLLGGFTAIGSSYLLENPEAHLHPRSQSLIGVFLALAANGVDQLFVETHSDHVLNGVRLAVKYGIFKPEDISVLFFERKDAGSKITRLEIGANGRLSDWPEGFFDQIETDLARL